MCAALRRTHYELMLPGNPSSLAMIRWVVTRLATAAGMSSEAIDQVEVAVDEACTNVLDHAYSACNPKPPLHIQIDSNDERFVVDIIDQGKAFDAETYTEPKFPDHWLEGNERGVGMYLIRQFMDDVQYESFPNVGNRMRLIKRRAPTETSGSAAEH